jgi:hypothetical protein
VASIDTAQMIVRGNVWRMHAWEIGSKISGRWNILGGEK